MTPDDDIRPLWRGRALAFIGVVFVAANLRTAVASLSPIVGQIGVDIPLSPVLIGLIGTAPPVCFALFGVVTPMLARRLGLERLLVLALLALVVGLLGRAVAPVFALLSAGTVLAFAGIAAGNVLLPPLIKKYFPDRIGLLTTAYITVMSVTAALPPLIAVPVADAAGWRVSLGMWGACAAIALIPWVALLIRTRSSPAESGLEAPDPAVVGTLWRSPIAWSLAVLFTVSSLTAYTMFAWMPTFLVEIADVETADAGGLVAVFIIVSLPPAIVVPLVAARARSITPFLVVGIVPTLAGYAGLLLAPSAAPVLWVALVGAAQLFFPLALVLINLRTRSHEASVALSGFVQSVGYAIAALAPVVVGVLVQTTGGWTASLTLLAVVALAAVPAGVVVARPRTIEDETAIKRAA